MNLVMSLLIVFNVLTVCSRLCLCHLLQCFQLKLFLVMVDFDIKNKQMVDNN